MAAEALLRLRAEDADDLAVISAIVQDALIAVGDLTYDRAQRRFTLVVNRFRWESRPDAASHPADAGTHEAPFERTLCAVSFGAVDSATYRGFRRRDDKRILSLLAIRPTGQPGSEKPGNEKPGNEKPGGEKLSTIDIEFSGGATLRLGVSAIEVHATDLGEGWPTAWQPDHSTSDPP